MKLLVWSFIIIFPLCAMEEIEKNAKEYNNKIWQHPFYTKLSVSEKSELEPLLESFLSVNLKVATLKFHCAEAEKKQIELGVWYCIWHNSSPELWPINYKRLIDEVVNSDLLLLPDQLKGAEKERAVKEKELLDKINFLKNQKI